jgi:hypothetical protein
LLKKKDGDFWIGIGLPAPSKPNSRRRIVLHETTSEFVRQPCKPNHVNTIVAPEMTEEIRELIKIIGGANVCIISEYNQSCKKQNQDL